jgi:intermediate peptidase
MDRASVAATVSTIAPVPLLPLLTAAAAFALAVAHETAAVLQPWDQEFYTRQLSTTKPHVKASTAAAPYLQLGSILQGLSQLLQQLLGLQLQLQPLQPGEGWAPGVLKVSVSCQDLGQLGVLYLDLLTRPGKPGASGILYPLRCGRQLPGKAGRLLTTTCFFGSKTL